MADNKTNKNQRKILATAEEEFLMKGFAGARTAEIAQGAGVTHAMLHYYFNSKEQLFEQVMNEKFLQLREMVAMVSASEELPVVERIVEVMVRNFDFLRRNPDLPRFIINEVIAQPEYIGRMKNDLFPALKATVARLQHDLDAAAAKGEAQRVDAATLLMDMLSMNCFPFMIAPIVATANPGMDFQAFFDARIRENVQIVLNRICPA